jgi:ABC-2 type transport system ATP-binding protein
MKPDAGCVLVDGKPINGGSVDVRTRVGVCPQEVILWGKLTCMEQLQFIGEMYGIPGRVARQRGEKLLEDLDLVDKRNKQAHTLSGGMQRRLNLAMALVHDPEIVVLDEPEAGLDPQSRVRVREYIQSLAHHKTVILTTHNMDEADRVADRVAIIDRGELLVLDTPTSLKHSVGEGDVLEIGVKGNGEYQQQAIRALEPFRERVQIHTDDGALHIRALNIVSLLPEIIERLKVESIPLGEVRLRENTLEDVFIRLTGRRLRE